MITRLERLRRTIQKYDVITFDVFDTLLKRDAASPKDIFSWTEQLYQEQFGEKLTDYRVRRVQAEQDARMRTANNEIQYEDIFDYFVGLNDEQKKRCATLELQVEQQCCTDNIAIKALFQHCIVQGKRVFLISDMYLSERDVKTLLDQCGITGYERLYVSSTCDVRKKDGALFRYFLKQEQLRPGQVLHIGNSKKADVLGAAKAGIHAFWIPTYEDHCLYSGKKDEAESLSEGYLRCFVNNRMDSQMERSSKIGYEVLGPIVFGFSKWLHEKIDGYGKVLFFSRDMHLFYKAYNEMYPQESARTEYVYLSRKALLPAVLAVSNRYDVIFGQWSAYGIAVEKLFELLHLDIEKYKDQLEESGVHAGDQLKLSEMDRNVPLCRLLAGLESDIREANLEEAALVMEYLTPFFTEENVAIVDLGWHSTIQVYLQLIFEEAQKSKHLKGFYLGTNGPRKSFPIIEEGYLFDTSFPEYNFKTGSFLMECFCLELTGTVLEYKKSNGEIKPVLDQCDQDDLIYMQRIQDGCLKFIRDFLKPGLWQFVSISAEVICKAYQNLLNCPSKIECQQMKKVTIYDHKKYNLVLEINRKHYLRHPGSWLQDLLSARWKAAFLKETFRLSLRWNDLYYGIVGAVKKSDI